MSPRLLSALLAALAASAALAAPWQREQDDPDAPQWTEAEVALPAFPQEANLRPFYVSEMTAHKFYIDASALSVGADGVVRYVLVVRTHGGATNISFEGIRCESRELKIYATGRQDGTWAKARKGEWRLIENKPVNRQHAALSREMFCPNGIPLRSVAEGLEALRLGKHPDAM